MGAEGPLVNRFDDIASQLCLRLLDRDLRGVMFGVDVALRSNPRPSPRFKPTLASNTDSKLSNAGRSVESFGLTRRTEFTSSVLVGVSGPVVRTEDMMDAGVDVVERGVGVVRQESSGSAEGVTVEGAAENENSF